jgi:hypothetical protein
LNFIYNILILKPYIRFLQIYYYVL